MSGDAPDPPVGQDPARNAYESVIRAARTSGAGQRRVAGRRSIRALGDDRRGGYSGAGPDRRDPQPFGRMVKRLVEDRGWQAQTTTASVIGRWDYLVGPEIAARCQPESLRDGELTLVAESTAWATQLRLMAPRIIAKLRAELGPKVVERVRVHGPAAPSWRKGPRTVRGRGPRDTYG